jgi:putative holliday junction resolvase
MRRMLGLDVGDRRIGVAVSDALGLLATPLETVQRKNMKLDVSRIAAVAAREEVGAVIIGLPLNMDNSEGPQAAKARSFGKQLARATGLPIHLEDERLSTFSAVEALVANGIKTGHNRELVDMQAAAIILQSFLDRRRAENDA